MNLEYFNRIRFVALLTLCVCSTHVRAEPGTVLVQDGQPRAAIVVADERPTVAQEAAEAFQDVVRQMTGAQLPIKKESEFTGNTTVVLVGPSELARKMGIDVEQDLEQADHYLIRTGPDYVALLGNDHTRLRGSVHATYDLLQRLGCGWFGPDSRWQVIPKTTTLTVPTLDIDERPAFQMRQIWMVKDRRVNDSWRLGGIDVPCNHNLERLVPPQTYAKDHPDWFGTGKGQPCLTNPEVVRVVVEQFRERLDREDGVVNFSVAPNDNADFCHCNRCRAAGENSARTLKFANAVARELAKTHPGRYRVCFLAYWTTHDTPRPLVPAEPGVVVLMVNEGDHTKPWDQPELPRVGRESRSNTRELRAFTGWKKTGAALGIYEWWIPGCSNPNWRRVPWYSGEAALRNLRYWKENGVRYITYETQYEDGDGFPIRWPLYYVAARGLWDPNLTAEQIMTEACAKLYGPAAKEMLSFYQVLEKTMLETTAFGRNWHLPSPETVYHRDVERQAAKYLHEAAEATDDPAILARIADERRMWNQARQTMSYLRRQYTVTLADKTLHWPESIIDTQTVRDIFGLKEDVPLSVIDGQQKRPAKNDETFDLTKHLQFGSE